MLLAALLFGSAAATAASAAELTAEQKFQVLREKGIFAGFSDGSSGLYQSMTREQFAQVLYKLLELPPPSGSPTYKDVLKTRWSYQQIEAVREAGLMVGVGEGYFAPESPVTVEQLAAVLARSYGKHEGTLYVVGQVSPWARQSVGIALLNDWIPQMKDYRISATRGLLVEATYAVYMQSDTEPLDAYSVVPISNQQIRVDLRKSVTDVDESRFRIRDYRGVELTVFDAVVGWDGRSVTVITEPQVSNHAYTLYVDGVPWSFVSLSYDTAKPTVISFSKQWNQTLMLVFSEQVDRDSATRKSNYSINNRLDIKDVSLAGDERTVTITTGYQEEGTQYRLTVKNVEDLAGNKMADWSTVFPDGDLSGPKATFKFNPSTAQITVAFNEKVNPDIAVNLNRYSIDHGLAVTRAVLDGDGKTVYLTTSRQKDATVYTLSVSGIPDLAGNYMANATFQFGGVANPSPTIQLKNIDAYDQNTLEVTFSRALSAGDLSKLKLTILKDNGKAVSMSGWQQNARLKPGSADKTAIVQFRTEHNTNPALFVQGHVYEARVSGIDGLDTASDADVRSFAGTENRNVPPEVKEVVPLSSRSVKIVFSEPVKNISRSAFTVREIDGDYLKIEDDGVDEHEIVTEIVLKLDDRTIRGHTYVIAFRSGTVTDAAGWNEWVTKIGDKDATKTFRGV